MGKSCKKKKPPTKAKGHIDWPNAFVGGVVGALISLLFTELWCLIKSLLGW